ncbi:unnamed protein product [Brassica oleracea]
MVRCVHLWRGEWKKSVDQEWDFMTDPEDYGYRVLVSKSASFEALDQLVRRRYSLGPRTPVISYRLPSWLLVPQGNKTPPLTFTDTTQLSMVLNVRTWLDELAVLVTIGANGVAEYQFLRRTNFTIGATSYVFDESATDNLRAAYENRGAQTERVMNAIFPEEGMLLFHRVSLEMSFADNFLVNRNRRTPPPREIIELDDDDDEMGDGTQPTVRTVRNAFIFAGVGAAANAPTGGSAQAEAPPIFWDVGMNVVDYTTRRDSPYLVKQELIMG